MLCVKMNWGADIFRYSDKTPVYGCFGSGVEHEGLFEYLSPIHKFCFCVRILVCSKADRVKKFRECNNDCGYHDLRVCECSMAVQQCIK